ncbi:MAG: hypothetical protein J6U54_16855 [Clostridiales bacterium]|nr:hypothetical protein [Clostridiales bacterium]
MAIQIIELKDLPIITTGIDINNEDRLVVSHLFDSNTRASTSMTMEAFSNGLILAALSAMGHSRLYGLNDPSANLGTNGDLYFKYVPQTKAVSDVYFKYEGEWLNLKGG